MMYIFPLILDLRITAPVLCKGGGSEVKRVGRSIQIHHSGHWGSLRCKLFHPSRSERYMDEFRGKPQHKPSLYLSSYLLNTICREVHGFDIFRVALQNGKAHHSNEKEAKKN